MISPEELQTILDQLDAVEAENALLRADNDFLHRERLLLKEGPQALLTQFKQASATEPTPPGYTRGAAGQLVLTDHARVYALMKAMNARD